MVVLVTVAAMVTVALTLRGGRANAATHSGNTVATSTTTTTTPACTLQSAFANWSNIQLINQLVAVPVNVAAVPSVAAAARQGYGGIILFGWSAPSSFGTQIAAVTALVPRHLGMLVMTDDEGGQVWRAANIVAPLPWAKWMSAGGPAYIKARAATAGAAMAAVGINMDLAPVLDLDARAVVPSPTNADGLRSFSGNAATAAADGTAFLRGLASAGVLGVIKHFPGLGGVSPDTDYGPARTAAWPVVQKTSLVPFAAAIAAGATAMMVSNVTIPGLTSGPATVSRAAITGVIRGQMHFNGLVLTDSLSAGAVSLAHLSVPVAAVDAIVAGADMVLFTVHGSTSPVGEANRVSQALAAALSAGRLSRLRIEQSAARVLEARGFHPCPSATLVG